MFDFAVSVTVVDDVIVLAGDLDARSTAVVREVLYEALIRHPRVVVDLAGVENVDVVALRVLAMATRHAARRGREVRLREPGPAVRRLLRLTRLARLVQVERDTGADTALPAGAVAVPA